MFQYKQINNFLTKDQCQSILNYSLDKLKPQTAKIVSENGAVVDSHRKSKIVFDKFDEFGYLKKKVMNLVLDNVSVNGYEMTWNDKGYQFTLYDENDFYNWHTDNSHGRYCSVVIQLNEGYDGGNLELRLDEETVTMEQGVGNAIIFLSSVNHRVTEILKGTRYSLVNWLTLSPIKGHEKSII
jgi:PKHD-type hydroxylase